MNFDLTSLFSVLSNIKVVASVFGVGVFGSVGIVILLRKTIISIVEAVEQVRVFVNKYEKFFVTGEGKEDFKKLKCEVDEALERIADIVDKIKFLKKYSQKLRDAIKLDSDPLAIPAKDLPKYSAKVKENKGREA